MEKMEVYTFEEAKDLWFGPVGTPERDEYEVELERDLEAFRMGEALKAEREAQNLTQEQLAQKMGVKKSQVWRLEHGRNPTMASVDRALRALGISASFPIGSHIVKLGL